MTDVNNFYAKTISKILSDVKVYIRNQDIYAAIKELKSAEKRLSSRKEMLPKAFALINELKKSIKYNSDDFQYENIISEGNLNENKNALILLINPSHSHEMEVEFWCNFCKQAKSKGFKIVDLAFRKSESFPEARMFTHPARMIDLSRSLESYSKRYLPDWITPDDIDLYVDWEHRRWQLNGYSPKVRLGCLNTIKYLDHVISYLKPAVILTTNKIDPPNYFAYLAALNYGIDYRFLERSPLDSYLMENSGMFTESNVVEDILYELTEKSSVKSYSDEQIQGLLNVILKNPYGFRASEASKEKFRDRKKKSKPIFFLPLDNLLWTGWAQLEHPQGNVDYPIFRNPEDALLLLNKHIKDLGGELIVKPHPSCKEWLRISKVVGDVKFSNADLDELCSRADVIITFLTKVSYLGLAKKKPVVSFGSGLLDNLGVTYQVKSTQEIKSKLKSALLRNELRKKYNIFRNLLPILDKRFFKSGKLAFDKLSNELTCDFKQINEMEIDNCFQTNRVKTKLDREIVSVNENKNTIILDVSRLLNSKLRFSGISRYTEALAKNVSKDPRLNVILCYRSSSNEYGLSGYNFNEVEKNLEASLFTLEDALFKADSTGKKYIFHSPINPLPEKSNHPNMLRVITVHDIFHLSHKHLYKNNDFITEKVVQSIEGDLDGILFVSDFSRKEFIEYTKNDLKNIAVTHLAADTAFTNRSLLANANHLDHIPYNNRILCFPYQNDPRKGFTRMVKVASKWLEKGGCRSVVIFGGSKKEIEVRSIISSISPLSANKFEYLSNLNDKQLSILYSRAVAQLYLSEAEGFGLPPLEAMACGCPSIMPNNTALAEVYAGWPFLLRSGFSDEEVLNYLDQISADAKQVNDIKIRYEAQKFALNYSWSETISQTIAFYLNNLMRAKED